jgi:LCP family protein required for cell wall assembly
LPRWAFAALGALFLLATTISAYLIYTTVRDFVVALGPSGSSNGFSSGNIVNATPGSNGTGGGGEVPIATIQAQQWNGADRVTVLVMGIDQRAGETDTAYRTDSMMLLTLDPVGRTAGMLSIPRDLYVEIPGFPDRDKITTANFKGDAYQLPGGGPQLAVDTIELNLGVRVDFYVRINFTAFEALVDQIGGIDINNPYEIYDPEYPDCCYGYDPFYLPAGQQHLDGAAALKFARTRHTTGDDFGRAERQQIVAMAVRDKLTSADNLPTLIANAPQLLVTLRGSYTTNMSPEQMLSLALLAKDIPRENITSAVIDQQYIADFYTTADNQQVLILNIEKFRELRDTMFYTPELPQLNVPNAAGLLAGEAATVEVQNGSLTAGLAATVADYLRVQGVNVVQVGNADRSDYASTIIVDYTGKPYTAKWLADAFHLSSSSILSGNDPASPVDVRVIIGADFALPGTP